MANEAVISETNTFVIGEICLICPNADYYAGEECEVIALPRESHWLIPDGRYCHGGEYLVRIGSELASAPPEDLRKKRPPAREDQQLTTWDNVVWQPKQVSA